MFEGINPTPGLLGASNWFPRTEDVGPDENRVTFMGNMVDGMKQMFTWHRDAISVFPVGQGRDVEVNEFDFRDNGGICYEENGVVVKHWQRSHAKDGASAYRLEWNGMSVVWTGMPSRSRQMSRAETYLLTLVSSWIRPASAAAMNAW
jgi:hypothetical protein